MPRIGDEFLNCVVYIYKSPEEAERAEKAGGTGFIVRYNLNRDNLKMYFVVTNAHVIKELGAPGAVRFNTKSGGTTISTVFQTDWICHPSGDDIAIASLNGTPEILDNLRHSSIDIDMFITEDILNSNNIGPGNETFSIGRFVKHDGVKMNTPIARCGNISMMPLEPIVFEGSEQISFLVESRSLSGFSGSPVFVYANAPYPVVNNQQRSVLLLGVDCGHFNIYESLREKIGETIKRVVSGAVSLSNSGQMIVVPAWKILEMLNTGSIADRIRAIEASS